MRMPCAGLAVAAVLLAVTAAPAFATPVAGNITRVGDNVIRISVTNNGSSADGAIAVELPAGIDAVTSSVVSGPPANCSPDPDKPNRIECLFDPPGMPAGATVVIEVLTNPRLEDNAGADAYSCGVPCDLSNMNGPHKLTGPAPPASADLQVQSIEVSDELDADTPFDPELELPYFDVTRSNDGKWAVTLDISLTNSGPSAAQDARVTVAASAAPRGTKLVSYGEPFQYGGDEDPVKPRCAQVAGSQPAPALCSYSVFPDLGTDTIMYGLEFSNPGAFAIDASFGSATPDPVADNNRKSYADAISAFAGAEDGRWVLASKLLTGRARGARGVFVALAEEEGGAKLSDSSPGGSGAAGSSVGEAAAAGCRWLRSARVRFRRERGRRCNQPSYLTAKVRRGRWKIRLRRKLPPGRYALVTQAVSRDGAIETAVGPRLGNMKRFRVRER